MPRIAALTIVIGAIVFITLKSAYAFGPFLGVIDWAGDDTIASHSQVFCFPDILIFGEANDEKCNLAVALAIDSGTVGDQIPFISRFGKQNSGAPWTVESPNWLSTRGDNQYACYFQITGFGAATILPDNREAVGYIGRGCLGPLLRADGSSCNFSDCDESTLNLAGSFIGLFQRAILKEQNSHRESADPNQANSRVVQIAGILLSWRFMAICCAAFCFWIGYWIIYWGLSRPRECPLWRGVLILYGSLGVALGLAWLGLSLLLLGLHPSFSPIATFAHLTSADRGSENVGIESIIVSELKLRDVQRQIFTADLVVAAHDAALNQRPETLNRVGMDRADDMLSGFVIDDAVRVLIAKSVIGWIGVGAKQTDLIGNCFVNKLFECCFVNAENDASDNVAFALHRAD